MNQQDLATKEAPVKWWAAVDAATKSYVNSTHHTENTKLRAERMKLALEIMYSASRIFISYGKRGVSIKLVDPNVQDIVALEEFEHEWEQNGVTKKVSSQGIIYRFNA